MKVLLPMKCMALLLPALLAFAPCAFAQYAVPATESAQAAAQGTFSQAELDQMLAPIALYPDPLLSQMLMAATYPLELVEAARWSRANPAFRGEDAVRAVQQYDWDPSVRSLVAFPRIVQMMDEKLDWTERLGNAFLAQEAQVMDTVQALRRRADEAGNLRSGGRIQVERDGELILIEPADPALLYVPYYNPALIYGAWWWPAYPPVYWPLWPEYDLEPGLAWGNGIVITVGFFFGDCDWRHHRLRVVSMDHDDSRSRDHLHEPGFWHHDPYHRRGVVYREPSLRERYEHVPDQPEMPHAGHIEGRARHAGQGNATLPPARGEEWQAPSERRAQPGPQPGRDTVAQPREAMPRWRVQESTEHEHTGDRDRPRTGAEAARGTEQRNPGRREHPAATETRHDAEPRPAGEGDGERRK